MEPEPTQSLRNEIQVRYTACEFLAWARKLIDAAEGDYPAFVLQRKEFYARRLMEMASDPSDPRHVQALNSIKFIGRSPDGHG
jgi:hypothetical protein